MAVTLRGYYVRNLRGFYLSRPNGPRGGSVWLSSWESATVFHPDGALNVCKEAWEEGEPALAMVPIFRQESHPHPDPDRG